MFTDLTNKKFGMLTVVKLVGTTKSRRIWRCKCDCGKFKDIREDSLKKYTRSCGCQIGKKYINNKTHGCSKTRLYRIWAGIKTRCNNSNDTSYKYYGKRGIKMCKEWELSFELFRDWALKNGYTDVLSIDRINVNGNYQPDNCRWATAKEQRENQRQYSITLKSKTHTLLEWEKITGIKYATLLWRYKQEWDAKKILTNFNYRESTQFKNKT